MKKGRRREDGNRQFCRAFEAPSFEEEKKRVLGKAQEILAQRSKWKELCKDKSLHALVEGQRADGIHSRLLKELEANLTVFGSAELFADREAMLGVLPAIGHQFRRCSSELRGDLEVLVAAVTVYPPAWQYASHEIRADRDATLRAIKANAETLEFASAEVQDDKEVVLAAVSTLAWALEFASDRLKVDRDVVLAAIGSEDANDEYRGSVLRFAGEDLQGDKGIVLAAIAKKSWALGAASRALQADREVVLAALRGQTGEDACIFGHNVLACASEELQGDVDLILEAIRVDGAAVALASLELRQDKDFLLKAMRMAPFGEEICCYAEAAYKVRESIPLQDFQGASNSALASPGEKAPVLSVAIEPAVQHSDSDAKTNRSLDRCQVTLLSGASFSCSLLPSADSVASPSPSVSADWGNQVPAEPELEPVQKRPRLDESNDEKPMMTLAELAMLLVAELPKHIQLEPPPERIFLVFVKPALDDHDDLSIPVTPWDWNRPISDFC